MADFGTNLAAVRPHVARFMQRFTNDPVRAEDYAADAIVKAWEHRDSFNEGTNLRGWVSFIARNLFLTTLRRKRWDGGSVDELVAAAIPTCPAAQGAAINLADALKAVAELPRDQARAVLLVGSGATYEEVAEELCCSVGTVKSRVARGRDSLRELLA